MSFFNNPICTSKIFVAFIFCSLTITVYAQPLTKVLQNDSVYSTLYGFADYYGAGNAVTNKFMSAYIKNNFLDDELKQSVYDNLKDKNKLAYHLETGIGFIHKKNKWGWMVQFQNQAHSASQFGSDLFRLYFGGNAQFKGETANLDNFDFNSIQFQSLGAGLLYHNTSKKIDWQLAIMPSIVKGQTAYKANSDGSLYTSSLSDSLYFDMNVAANFSDTASRKFSAWNGTGMMTDIYFRFGEDKNWLVTISLTNLGNVSWNAKSGSLLIDTNYAYTGIEIANILDSITLQINGTEEYKNSLLQYTTDNFTTTLPSVIDMMVQKSFANDNLHLGIGFRNVNDKVATPQFYFTSDYKLSSHLIIGANLYSGGYKPFSATLTARLSFGKFFIAPSVSFLEEIFRGNKGTATGAGVVAGWRF